MKRFIIFLCILATSFLSLVFVRVVWADEYGIEATAGAAGLQKSILGGETTVPGVVGVVVKIVLSVLGIVFFFLVAYAGIMWMTAGGNAEKVSIAKGILEAAVVGLVIVTAAYAITNAVFTVLTTGDNSTSSAPTPTTLGCCINKGQDGVEVCTKDIKQAECYADWKSGACPNTCVF